MSAQPERRAPKGCYVVIGHDRFDHTDYLVGHYISHSRARKTARNRARIANADPSALSDAFFVYDDAGQCRYRVSHDDLPESLRGPSCSADAPPPLPPRGAQALAPLTWRDWPTWLSLPILLWLAAFDVWYELTLHNGSAYWGSVILHRGLGVPRFPGMGVVSILLFYMLPLYLWLVHARAGLSWANIRTHLDLLRWVLAGLVVVGAGLGLMLATALAYLLGMEQESAPGLLMVATVAAMQIPYYLWLRRRPENSL